MPLDDPAKRIEASLLQPREGAGKYWWETFLRTHISDINRRFNQAKTLYLTAPDKVPVDLFSYSREAALCFEIGRYLPAIALASASARLILERDPRMRGHGPLIRHATQEVVLCCHNLMTARQLGLLTDELLSKDEVLGPNASIRFVERNNIVVRGDVSGWYRAISEYVPSIEHEALDQLEKAQCFLVSWFNTSRDLLVGE
jgi:hypothetical protein